MSTDEEAEDYGGMLSRQCATVHLLDTLSGSDSDNSFVQQSSTEDVQLDATQTTASSSDAGCSRDDCKKVFYDMMKTGLYY